MSAANRAHIQVEAISDTGKTVYWRRVDSVKQSNDGECFLVRDFEGDLVGIIPAKGWLVKIEYRTGKEGVAP